LFANINRCFVFSKNFELTVEPQTIYRQEIKLCTGKTFNSPSGNNIIIAGTYQDTLKNSFDCDSIVITKLSFNPIPISTQKQSICFGQPYTLPSGKVVNGSGLFRDTFRNTEGCLQIIDITLSTRESLQSSVSAKICEGQIYTLPKGKLVSVAGSYQDTIKLGSGCDSIVTTNLAVVSKPKVKIETTKTGELLEGETLLLTISSISGAIYSWFENGKKISQEQSSVTTTVKGGETIFKVFIKTDVCETSDSVKITGLPTIELPNAFTPNGDNLNDYFTIVSKSNNQDIYTIENFQIFDRFGKKVYTNENGLKGWDGKLNGEDLSSDVYFYFIKIQSPSGKRFQFSGDLSLIR
jgi:gliding motility-associated-like protein